MTMLACAIVLILILRWVGVAEPLTALAAALFTLLFVGLSFDKAALLLAGTTPRMLDYISLMIPLCAISAALLGGLMPDEKRPRRPFGWSTSGDLRFFVIYLAICALIADQFQRSIIQVFSGSFLHVVLLLAFALIANVAAAGRQSFSPGKALGSLAVLLLLIVPVAAPVLFGLFTPTEAVCIVLLPLSFLVRLGYDVANQRKLSMLLRDMIRGATDGTWILLAFFGATLIVYGLRLQGPLASVNWFATFSPAYFLAAYAALTILCCSLMGTSLGFLIAYAFFFAPFTEAGRGLQSETAALIALLCVMASLARPELGWKLVRDRASATMSRGQFAAFAAVSIFVLAVAFAFAPARF